MSRQFRSDDTVPWLYGYGNGSNGSLTISTNTTFSTSNAGCSGTSGTTSLTLDAASTFADNNLVFIHQTRGTGVGNWELNKIASGGGTTSIMLDHDLQNTYTNSGASQAQILELKQYSNVTVNTGINWTAPNWDQNKGGCVVFLCKGTTTITGNIILSGSSGTSELSGGDATGTVSGRGFRNGLGDGTDPVSSNTTSEGTIGDRITTQTSANGNGGGSGGGGGSGAGGGNGTAGGNGVGATTNGTGGSTAGNAALTSMVFGGGGGGGHWPGRHGSGGTGAGLSLIITKDISITGTINANGGSGGSATSGIGDSAGGGGAGGSVIIKAQTATLGTNKITATAGAGGTSSGSRPGGAGGVGRIHLDYLNTPSGTTNPTYDGRQDLSLKLGTHRFFTVF
jgi:hypothetical protein